MHILVPALAGVGLVTVLAIVGVVVMAWILHRRGIFDGTDTLADLHDEWGHEDPYPAGRLRLVVKSAEKTIPIHGPASYELGGTE